MKSIEDMPEERLQRRLKTLAGKLLRYGNEALAIYNELAEDSTYVDKAQDCLNSLLNYLKPMMPKEKS